MTVPIENRQAFIQAVLDAASAQGMTPRDVVFECLGVSAGLYIQCRGSREELEQALQRAWGVQSRALEQLDLDFGGPGFWDAPRSEKAVTS